jgi:uncharacterized small protein (DUF1192 family)
MDEDEVRPRKEVTVPRTLAGLSVEELDSYVALLKAEIRRTEAEIAKRRDVRGAADAFFKPRQG